MPRVGRLPMLLLVVGAVGINTAAPAAAADTSPPVIVSESVVGPSSFDLSGTTVAHVVVQVHITDDTGVSTSPPPECDGCVGWPFIRVSRPATRLPSIDREDYVLKLVSGTTTDGMWRASVPVSAGNIGTWSVWVGAFDDAGNQATQPSGPPPHYVVTGRDAPTLTAVTYTPNVAPSGYSGSTTIHGRVVRANSRSPVAGVAVSYGREIYACGQFEPVASVTTAADGSFTFSIVLGDPIDCVDVLEPLSVEQRKSVRPAHFSDLPLVMSEPYAVSAKATTPHLAVGQSTSVVGSVSGGYPNYAAMGRVLLQRWAGGVWHTVGSARVRESRRYTLVATPPSAGNWTYRVVKPSDICDPKAGRCLNVGARSSVIGITAR
jgi:hypothetical protein